MRLTTKGRYAVMAVLEIASRRPETPITLNEISIKQDISINYLEQIFAKLKMANIVKSVKGPRGGYIINEKLNNIKITNIIDAVDENIEMTRCERKSMTGCMVNKMQCNSHHLWSGLASHIRSYFDAISIADMLKSNEDKTDNVA
jgi:Rrf2 family iron-sulfur cluster assembly transcriptional regulator